MDAPKTLAAALAALQADLPHVDKTATGQYGNYADLAVVSKLLLPRLAAHGLAFTACPTLLGDSFRLHYELHHASGEAIAGDYPLPSSGTPQQMGSAITYARRYALCAITGLAPGGEDDDGQAAEDGAKPAARRTRAVPDAQLAAEGRMTRAQKTAHERAEKETKTAGHRRGAVERTRPREPEPSAWDTDAPVDHERAEQIRRSFEEAGYGDQPEERPGSLTPAQHRAIERMLTVLGIETDNRDARHAAVAGILHLDDLKSITDLSHVQAGKAIERLNSEYSRRSREHADA